MPRYSLLIDPGKMNVRITILQQETSYSSTGVNVQYTPLRTCYAEQISYDAEQSETDKQLRGKLVLVLGIHYQADVQPNMRVDTPMGLFVIHQTINVEGQNRRQILRCLQWTRAMEGQA